MGLTRAARLQQYFDAVAAVPPVVWGESDCCSWPAKWVEREIGKAVALPRYTTQQEAHALIAAAGGLARLAAQVLAPLNLASVTTPSLGDIGVIALSDRDMGVIFCASGHAALRKDKGGVLFIRPTKILAAWAV